MPPETECCTKRILRFGTIPRVLHLQLKPVKKRNECSWSPVLFFLGSPDWWGLHCQQTPVTQPCEGTCETCLLPSRTARNRFVCTTTGSAAEAWCRSITPSTTSHVFKSSPATGQTCLVKLGLKIWIKSMPQIPRLLPAPSERCSSWEELSMLLVMEQAAAQPVLLSCKWQQRAVRGCCVSICWNKQRVCTELELLMKCDSFEGAFPYDPVSVLRAPSEKQTSCRLCTKPGNQERRFCHKQSSCKDFICLVLYCYCQM